jgi:hypothetical protein
MTAWTETQFTAELSPRSVDTYADAVGEPFRGVHPKLAGYYGGFMVREVATLLHRPEGTIKADLFAARAKLKAAL